jgi:eukaryotic translation initiation factor 2C
LRHYTESQFQAVLSEELPALRRAFARLGDGSYNPPVTYVVAQKRHNTRLFVEDPRKDGEGRNGDVGSHGAVLPLHVCSSYIRSPHTIPT